MRILVELHKDRGRPGRLLVVDGNGETMLGPFQVLALADRRKAEASGNPDRDPLRPFGHTPTGSYGGVVSGPHEPAATYGPGEVIEMIPVAGDALKAAKNGRAGLWIHGGVVGAGNRLRGTHGCVRIRNEDLAKVIGMFRAEHERNRGTGKVRMTIQIKEVEA